MRDSIITTVYNRDPLVLRNTFSQLLKNNLADTEIIVVDDGSTVDYGEIQALIRQKCELEWIKVNTITDRPGTYNIDGYNNPAYAWNVALEAARGERIMMLVSDCMVQPDTVQKARKCKNRVYCPSVLDIDSGRFYLGPRRMCPFGWFASWRREDAGDIREDEEFLKGIAWEDNDFMARLALAVRTVVVDLGMLLFHQSHPQTAYSDGLKGHDINERYTYKKWGGAPWSGHMNDPLKVKTFRRGDEISMTVTRKSGDEQKLAEDHAFV